MWPLLRKARDFFAELKRRNVYQVAITYLAIAWAVCQVAYLLVPALYLPDWFFRAVVVAAGLCFPIALVLAWAFERTPEGVRRTPEARSRSESRGRREERAPAPRGERRDRDRRRPSRDRDRRQRSERDADRTVKVQPPSTGTAELLPAELEMVAGGDADEVVRFFDPGRGRDPVFTIGRRRDSSETHIQLDSPTVSRQQARIRFQGGDTILENRSATNPTCVNGEELGGPGSSTVVVDGDLIDMGELRFRYRER